MQAAPSSRTRIKAEGPDAMTATLRPGYDNPPESRPDVTQTERTTMNPKPPADTSWIQTTGPRPRTANAVRARRWGWATVAVIAGWAGFGAVTYLWWPVGSTGRMVHDESVNLIWAGAVLVLGQWRYWAGRRDQERLR